MSFQTEDTLWGSGIGLSWGNVGTPRFVNIGFHHSILVDMMEKAYSFPFRMSFSFPGFGALWRGFRHGGSSGFSKRDCSRFFYSAGGQFKTGRTKRYNGIRKEGSGERRSRKGVMLRRILCV